LGIEYTEKNEKSLKNNKFFSKYTIIIFKRIILKEDNILEEQSK
jgi:hypothetical protein